MCTLVVAHNLFAGFPMVVAANRDEMLDRPSEPPCLREFGIFAPKDLARGGTWIGVNKFGVFAGLTNRSEIKSQYGRISRGQIVMDALFYRTAAQAFKETESLRGEQFNGFHLVIADKDTMYLLKGNGVAIERSVRSGQLLVATNLNVGENDGHPCLSVRSQNILDVWHRNSLVEQEPSPENLIRLLDIHNPCVSSGTCIHQPEVNYGTKSSSIIRLNESKKQWEYWHRERTSPHKHICNEVFSEMMQFGINH